MIDMGTYIELDEESSALLDKYCNEQIRPAKPGPLLSRIVRPWYSIMAKSWLKNPSLIPKLEPIRDDKTHAIGMNKDHAKMFRDVLQLVNKRLEMEIGEVELASWLTKGFIKTYRIAEKEKGYRMKFGKIHRV